MSKPTSTMTSKTNLSRSDGFMVGTHGAKNKFGYPGALKPKAQTRQRSVATPNKYSSAHFQTTLNNFKQQNYVQPYSASQTSMQSNSDHVAHGYQGAPQSVSQTGKIYSNSTFSRKNSNVSIRQPDPVSHPGQSGVVHAHIFIF